MRGGGAVVVAHNLIPPPLPSKNKQTKHTQHNKTQTKAAARYAAVMAAYEVLRDPDARKAYDAGALVGGGDGGGEQQQRQGG